MIENLKILHTNFLSRIGSGIVNQLKAEESAASKLGLNWDILLVSHGKIIGGKEEFYHEIPNFFNCNYFLKRLYYHLYLQHIIRQKKYDLILYRYLKADIFSYLFQCMYKKRITVHHSKEEDEILLNHTLKSRVLLFIERFVSKRFLSNSLGLVAMTNEIAQYELRRIKAPIPTLILPNGIESRFIKLTDDYRIKNEVHVAFIAGDFLPWHGLDLLLDEMRTKSNIFKLHLIGNTPTEILNTIKNSDRLKKSIISHGYLDRKQINKILSLCDICLDSVALFRKNMTSACALKVREYLANGLPVFSAYPDSGLPSSFPYYRVDKINVDSIISYANEMKAIKRSQVRNASMQYIDKKILLDKLYKFIVKIISE